MFTDISWGSYITFMIALLAVYYLIIGLRFYRTDIVQLISGKQFSPGEKVSFTSAKLDQPNPSLHQANLQQAFEKQDMYQSSQSLGDEIMAYLHEAGRDTLSKEDVAQSLKLLIGKYPSIKDSAFRGVIENLILTESETNCSIHLSEEELSELW